MLRLAARAANTGTAPLAPEEWRVLRLLSQYRLLLVGLILLLVETGHASTLFGEADALRLHWIGLLYAGIAVILMGVVVLHRPALNSQAHLHLLGDLLCLGLLVHACGGVPTGLGALVITPVVGCSLVLTPRMAMLEAAVATLTMFSIELSRRYDHDFDSSDFTATGVLGLMLFGASAAANAVAQRARSSEALAERMGNEFATLAQLNDGIVAAMQTGVLVVDADDRVVTLNAAARRMLRLSVSPEGHPLNDEAPTLAARLRQWRLDGQQGDAPVPPRPGGADVVVHFTRLGAAPRAPMLLLIDDPARLREQAQQLKLAALGRLSASIAHEIRNPLSAIQQAGQLLAESEGFADPRSQSRRLLAMIQRHGDRIENIVRDVLALSRREPANPVPLALKDWLVRAAALYHEGYTGGPRPIEIADVPALLAVRFDPSHLQQVLFNLWDNAFLHGGGGVTVLLSAGTDDLGRPWLDVADNGPGVDEGQRDSMFEPFFTTATKGYGLGLYLVRELCEYNLARVAYRPAERGGACFRLTFSLASA